MEKKQKYAVPSAEVCEFRMENRILDASLAAITLSTTDLPDLPDISYGGTF